MEKYILVTGTSSGLGNALVHLLASKGYKVFATVRNEKDKHLFAGVPHVIPILLDVAKTEEVQSVYNTIKLQTGDKGLYALINNAGINYLSAFELAEMQREKQLFEVNLFGAMDLTRKLLPLMHSYVKGKNNKAKIINVSSMGAVFSLPWESSYHASKFAMLGWSQSLRYELGALNISVCCFLPGGMKTNIFDKSVKAQEKSLQDSSHVHFDFYQKNQQHMNTVLAGFGKSAVAPEKAANAILHLLAGKNMPFKKYFGTDAQFIRLANWLGITGLLKNRFIVSC